VDKGFSQKLFRLIRPGHTAFPRIGTTAAKTSPNDLLTVKQVFLGKSELINKMKTKTILLMLSGLLAGSLAVSAQDNPPATNAGQPESAASTNPENTNSTGAPTGPGTDAAATESETTGTTTTQIMVAPGEAPAEPELKAAIPLIVMDDVPLTDAIKNLARQASLNYLLDPKIAFGQPDASGRLVPQPSVSIRWENITAEQALLALLNNYGLQLVPDPKTKIARITVKDPAAPDPLLTKIIQLKYTSPSNIIASVSTALVDKRSKIKGDTRTSQLVVLATEKELNALEQMVEKLDTPTRQVLIEAKLLETSLNPESVKGLDWSGTLEAQKLRFGNNLQDNVTADSINDTLSQKFPNILFDTAKGFNPATAFLDADGVTAVFSFLNKNAEAKVISSPRTVTLDNESASISVTRQYPIFTTTAGTANTPGGSSVTYSNLGVILNVTPRITADNRVNLRVLPEVSRIFDEVTAFSQGQANTAYIFDSRKLETTVMIPSGNTLVLGGLVTDDIRNSDTKVPVLGDIPILGHAFRSNSKSRQKSNLLIFITPTIVQDSDFQATKTDFLQTPLVQDSDPDWGYMDSGKPYDWSKKRSKKVQWQ
jgi:type II secretory pathway component GspD/PulD (secretin)